MPEDFDGVISEYLAWSLAAFPESTAASVAAHILKEARELTDAPDDAEELADVVMLAFHSAARQGIDLTATIARKLPVLRARVWSEPDANGVREHVRVPCPGIAWTAFSDAFPEERHRYLLVKRDAAPSAVWLVEPGTVAHGELDGEARGLSCPGLYALGRLTHWRYALPEEG
jgi:hypothetical protein